MINSLHLLVEFLLRMTFAQHQQDTTAKHLITYVCKGKKGTEEFSPCSWERGSKLIAETILPLHHEESSGGGGKRSLSAVRKCASGFFTESKIVIHVCISFLIIFLRAAPAHCACLCFQQKWADAQVDIPTRPCLKLKKRMCGMMLRDAQILFTVTHTEIVS